MMAKIVKGQDFKGVVNYILNKNKGTEILDGDGLRLKSPETIIQSFRSQAEINHRLKKPVGHISLDFSAQDKEKLTNKLMVEIAREYMDRMGIKETQYLIGRHYDKQHPHIHLVFNRVDNRGETISDRNDHFRSEKICKELTRNYGLYFATGKENVKEHRLREPDKTKYEIFNSLKTIVPKCYTWDQLTKNLNDQDIGVTFKYKGKTSEIQGVIFDKNGLTFNGSKIDRQFSYLKISQQLKYNVQNLRPDEKQRLIPHGDKHPDTKMLNDLFDSLIKHSYYRETRDDLEAIRKFKNKKKKKKGMRP